MSCMSNMVTLVCLVGYSTFRTELGPRDMSRLSSLAVPQELKSSRLYWAAALPATGGEAHQSSHVAAVNEGKAEAECDRMLHEEIDDRHESFRLISSLTELYEF